MPAPSMSRRTFLAAAGLGKVGLLGGCDLATLPTTNIAPTFTPNPSPAALGPYQVGRVILGQDAVAASDGLPQFFGPNIAGLGDTSQGWMATCPDGTVIGPRLVPTILAAVYYPYRAGTDHRVPTPNPLQLNEGPFPVLLYAHAFREPLNEGCIGPHTANLDFTSVEVMLRHVASSGCVCVVPDLSWIGGGVPIGGEDPQGYDQVVVARAKVLLRYFLHLRLLNNALFAHQLHLTHLVLVGHSTGGAAAVEAGLGLAQPFTNLFPAANPPHSVAFGLIAPVASQPTAKIIHGAVGNVVVLKGSQDTMEVFNGPEEQFQAAGPPKTFVTTPWANHFGYTDICPFDNSCATARLIDLNGTITRAAQQLAGASYLTALVRFYTLGEASMRPYLTGEKPVEGLENFVTGIQVHSVGLPLSTPTPSQPTPAPHH